MSVHNPIIPSEPMRNAVKTSEHDPRLVAALQTIKAKLEALPEQLRGPFIVKGLAPYANTAPEPQPEVAAEPVACRLALAKAFHDGPLMADDHEFIAESEQGKWCLSVVDFIADRLATPSVVEEAVKADAKTMRDALSGASAVIKDLIRQNTPENINALIVCDRNIDAALSARSATP